jgi:hypothetical protein
MNEAASSGFQFVRHWKIENDDNDNAVMAFWKSENAVPDEAKAKERLKQVVLHARDASGAVAGVCTVMPIQHPRLGQPMYYYRCFIGKTWRKTRLVFTMLVRAFDTLEADAREHDFPCIGMVLELENARFGKTLRAPVWQSTGFTYIGISQRNLDLRVRYFRGARLKKT